MALLSRRLICGWTWVTSGYHRSGNAKSIVLLVGGYTPNFVLPPEGISFKEVTGDFERRLIETTLEAAGGVQKRAAELLHIKPTTLNEMIKRYDIRPRRKKGGDEGEALR